jgi:type I restriction enzyme S subunit
MKNGWEVKTLNQISENLDRKRVPITKKNRSHGSIPYYGASGIVDYVEEHIFDEDLLLVSEDGANLLARTYPIALSISGKTWVNNHAHVLRFKDKISQRFVELYLNSIKLDDFVSGMAQPKLNQKMLNKIPIPFPPISEQKRIVAMLDEAFEKITKAKKNAEKNLKNTKDVFESYLQSVFENKGDGWEERTLGEITTKIGSGATPRGGNKSYKTEGISLIRSMNVHDRYFKEKNLAFIDEDQANNLSNVTLQEDDVLFNITGASVTRCCVIPAEYLPARVNQHVSIIRPKPEIMDSSYLNLLLTSKYYKDQLLFTGEQGATRQAITKVQLQEFVINYPLLKEQKAIVTKLGVLSSETKRLEEIYEKKLADLEELKKSILAKAFNGELTEASA